jgi:hypothetical protein
VTKLGHPVLLDNCAISACCDAGAWKALVSRYKLETVEEVASEAATGYQHREIIDPKDFREQVVIHKVSRHERLAREIEFDHLGSLDDGERDLWVHAMGREDGWILCGPDTASIRFGVMAGHAGRLVSLEELLNAIGYSTKGKLKEYHSKKWLTNKIEQFVLELEYARLKK